MRSTVRNPSPQYESTSNPLSPPLAGSSSSETEWIVEAVVVDVIVNEEHPECSTDGYNVGCVKFRLIKDNFFRPTEVLHWAFPIDANVEEFPLKNEIVHIFESLNRFYYTRKINLGNRSTHQAYFGLDSEMSVRTSVDEQRRQIQSSNYAPINQTAQLESLGEYFQDLPNVLRLRHWEGDKIIEGRSGHSIRFGTAWMDPRINRNAFIATNENQSPNILMRIGPSLTALRTTETYAARVVEDINDDDTSMWMVSDQNVPLKVSTIDNSLIHGRSIPDYPRIFNGNQFIVNTGRLILNSKTDKILIHSAKGFHVTTLLDSTMDVERDNVGIIGRDKAFEILRDSQENVARNKKEWIGVGKSLTVKGDSNSFIGRDLNINVGRKASIISSRVYVGSDHDSSEPMVLGMALVKILQDIINAHINAATYVITPSGPGTLDPTIVTKLQKTLSELNTILSRSNFVSKENEAPIEPTDRVAIHPR